MIVNGRINAITARKISSVTAYNKTIHVSKEPYLGSLDPTFVQGIDVSQSGFVGELTAVVNTIVSKTNIMDGVILREATIVSTWELVMLNKVKCPGYIHQIKNDYKIDIALIYYLLFNQD